MSDPSENQATEAWVRRVALGCTDVGTLLIGCGGVCYGILVVVALGLWGISVDRSEFGLLPVLTNAWFIFWSVAYWLSVAGLLTGGLRLRRPSESARASLDRSSLALIVLWVVVFGATSGTSAISDVASGESVRLASELVYIVTVLGVPVVVAVGYLWRLRNALWSRAMIETCGGEAPQDLTSARRAMNRRTVLWALGGTAVGGLVALLGTAIVGYR